jgi:hypothetical protein
LLKSTSCSRDCLTGSTAMFCMRVIMGCEFGGS